MLRLANVRKSYVEPNGNVLPVIDIESFHVAPGEQMVLVGRSGSGKSTLLHVIGGITRPDSGDVIVDGQSVAKLSEPQRDRLRAQKIGYVFQTFNLLPAFSALENVLLGMAFTGQKVDPARAKELLDRVGLAKRLSHKPAMLSVGEQQRVAVARALSNRPKLLLADEPTANVDAGNQQHLIDLIRQSCRDENVSLVLVTHANDIAAQFDRVERLEEINRVGAAV
ncbi:MAG: ABC transporter ATP-binding protein [Pirellulales bacterium]